MISAVVLTLNEERHLPDCLASLHWADEIVVLDSGSRDRTQEIARQHTDRVFVRPFDNYSRQRNAALDLARGDWVLFVDADERVPAELAAEVRDVVANAEHAGYWVPRRNWILGRWIAHSGWHPDYQLRLLRRGLARYNEQQAVHEVADVQGSTGTLQHPLVHINYERLSEFLTKQRDYAAFEARTLWSRGIRPKPQNYVLQPLRELKRRYVTWEGYKDGGHGLLLACLMAGFSFVTYVELARLWREHSAVEHSPDGVAVRQANQRPGRAAAAVGQAQPGRASLDPTTSLPMRGTVERGPKPVLRESDPSGPPCSVVIVSYNVADLLERCIASVLASPAVREVIVVDNASTDGSADRVSAAFPQAQVIRNTENVGFARGINRAVAESSGRYVLVLNPDCEVRPGAIERLCEALDADPEVAVVGPRTYYGDGSPQSSRRRFPSLLDLFVESTVLEQYGIGRSRVARVHCEDLPEKVPADVDWLVGACLLVRRAALCSVGLLDEGYFMYFEELDWCRRFRQAGWRVRYVPEAEVVHLYGKSAEQDTALRDIRFSESKLRYARKWHGPLAARALRWFLFAHFGVRLGVETAKLALLSKPSLRIQRIGQLRRVFASGLRIG